MWPGERGPPHSGGPGRLRRGSRRTPGPGGAEIELFRSRLRPSSLNGFPGGLGVGFGLGVGAGATGAGVGVTGCGTGTGSGRTGAGFGAGFGAGPAGAGAGLGLTLGGRKRGSAAARVPRPRRPEPRALGQLAQAPCPGVDTFRGWGSSRAAWATAYEIENAATTSAPSQRRRRGKSAHDLAPQSRVVLPQGTDSRVDPALHGTRILIGLKVNGNIE